jgi:cyanate lyase
MKRSDLTEKLLDIKREKGWSWKHICETIGGYSEVLIVGAILGQMKLTKPQAANAAELFGLSKSETAMLNETPMRGMEMPPTDPLIYRFYELVMVNGPAWKALIEEEYGDGIMSAIDFDMVMERLPNPKGDRVKITMSGKFLPYKYYGASGNVPEKQQEKRRDSPPTRALRDGLLPRLYLHDGLRHQFVHLGAKFRLGEGDAFGVEIGFHLAKDTVAGFLEVGGDDLFRIGAGGFAGHSEPGSGP